MKGPKIEPETFERMLAYGWCDGLGRSLTWAYWQRYWTAIKVGAFKNG